jgi:putative oxidoreductase
MASKSAYRLSAADWTFRGSVALAFVMFGMEKLTGTSWVKLFADIGLGQWFRYFTGAVQVTGAALLLIPRTARVGAGFLACTMLGAMFVHVFVLGTGMFAIIPAILLSFAVAAGWKGRGEPEQSGDFLSLR